MVVMTALVSCLETDEPEFVYSKDTAISYFSVGNLKRTVHTKSSKGVDSTYREEVYGSYYKFYIDQQAGKIYNPDSLPQGIDPKHIIVNITSKNSARVVYKSMISDTLFYYQSADSIDFSQPREFRVYDNKGDKYRSYEVKVNIHKESPDSFKWKNITKDANLGQLAEMKAVENNGKMFLFGVEEGKTVCYSTDINDGASWTKTATAAGASASKNVIAFKGNLFMLDGGELKKSADANSWETVGSPEITQLLGAGSKRMYGLKAGEGFFFSEDNGASWTAENCDGDKAYLPQMDYSLAVRPSITNDDVEQIVVVGNRDESHTADSVAVVWSKTEDYGNVASKASWELYKWEEDNHHKAPRLSDFTIMGYGRDFIAIGGKALGTCKHKDLDYIYRSIDGGLTWYKSAGYYLPEHILGSVDNLAITVDSNYCVWIITGTAGEIWKGRLNKMGWASEQTSFR